jgi:hypothetical protein
MAACDAIADASVDRVRSTLKSKSDVLTAAKYSERGVTGIA